MKTLLSTIPLSPGSSMLRSMPITFNSRLICGNSWKSIIPHSSPSSYCLHQCHHTAFVTPYVLRSLHRNFFKLLTINQFPNFPQFPPFPLFPLFPLFPPFPSVSIVPSIPLEPKIPNLRGFTTPRDATLRESGALWGWGAKKPWVSGRKPKAIG